MRLAEAHKSNLVLNKPLDKRRIEAGLPALSPHDLWRTWAGDLLDP
ncbi:MAG: hypothetical protein AVDCRST_MAG93-7460, partial [uncultured Chloroflexia bacterium]